MYLGLQNPFFRTVKSVDEIASVNEIKLFNLTNLILSVTVTLVCDQVFDFPPFHLFVHHVHKPLRVVVSFDVVKRSA